MLPQKMWHSLGVHGRNTNSNTSNKLWGTALQWTKTRQAGRASTMKPASQNSKACDLTGRRSRTAPPECCHGPTYVTILYLKRDRQGFSNCLRFTGLKQQQVFKDIAFQSFSLFLSPRRINRISKAFLCVHQVQHFLHVSLTLQLRLRKANKQWLQHQHSHLAEMLCQTPHMRWDRLGNYEEISHFFPAEQVSQQTARSVTD